MKRSNNPYKVAVLTMLFSLRLAGAARADIIALYPFTGNSRVSTVISPNSVVSAFLDGPGFIGGTDFQQTGNPSPAIRALASATSTSQALALSNNDYFFFRVTPNPGFSFNLQDLTLDTSSTNTDENIFIRSSVDNYQTDLASFLRTTTNFQNTVVDLSGAAFDNITSTMEFRFYVYDNSDSDSQGARFDNVTLNGTNAAVSAVPEPSTSLLMLVGLGSLAAARRRKNTR
jgi:PEP-CTERM motif